MLLISLSRSLWYVIHGMYLCCMLNPDSRPNYILRVINLTHDVPLYKNYKTAITLQGQIKCRSLARVKVLVTSLDEGDLFSQSRPTIQTGKLRAECTTQYHLVRVFDFEFLVYICMNVVCVEERWLHVKWLQMSVPSYSCCRVISATS